MPAYDPPDSLLDSWFADLEKWDRESIDGATVSVRTVHYGDHQDQVADVWQPVGNATGRVVVSIHGGFFAEEYKREIHTPLSRALACRGFTVWNVEYRRAAPGHGGFRETTDDIRRAVTFAAASESSRVALVGHSAGGYLAEWASALEPVDLVVTLAAVTDLEDSARSGDDDGAVSTWLRASPDHSPEIYKASRLRRKWPTGARHVMLHGTHDQTVPATQSRRYAAAALTAGEDVTLTVLAETGHYAFIDPRQPAFQCVVHALAP
ncbi:alpha/beta hydrolase family protein [Paenarthrobacter aurescens]|uniref:alpha/beta hydrolase family protein n=1 Tax=Paenarthrobacter aurescens TaxID=43663 RepID=UPI0021C08101|nr:alpha/beta hydrolase [Paenarthrobacter aurescens]MCT9870418.1 alpha/beta hydrolase [Paenarthrobacter aurescens]